MLKFYGYSKCSTCVKAKKFLKDKDVAFKDIEIVDLPPSKTDLKKALKDGYGLKDLFNKSGQLYREMNMKEKLPNMSEAEALDLLAKNGKLIKRPFVIGAKQILVGFKEDQYAEAL